MDEDGYAHFAAIENLASRARVSVEEAKSAIDAFLAPDANSSNPDNEGRRIEKVPGGYMILNAPMYREIATKLNQKEQTRARVARYRAQNQPQRKSSVTKRYTPLHSVYASDYASSFSEGESEGKPLGEIVGPVIDDALKWLSIAKNQWNADFTEAEVRSAFAALRAKGFKWGEAKLADWRAGLERQIYTDRKYGPAAKSSAAIAPEQNQKHEHLTVPRICPKD